MGTDAGQGRMVARPEMKESIRPSEWRAVAWIGLVAEGGFEPPTKGL
jgi:hypothetical protein